MFNDYDIVALTKVIIHSRAKTKRRQTSAAPGGSFYRRVKYVPAKEAMQCRYPDFMLIAPTGRKV